jgi:hypothetical protein
MIKREQEYFTILKKILRYAKMFIAIGQEKRNFK